MTATTQTDVSIGIGLLFSVIAIGTAVVTAVLGYSYAISESAGEAAHSTQSITALAFGFAMLTAVLAVAAFHLYER